MMLRAVHTVTALGVVAVVLLIGGVRGATDCTYMGSLLTYYINGVNGPCWPGFLPFTSFPEISKDSLFSEFYVERYFSGDEVATYIEVGGAYIPNGKKIGDLGPEHLFLVETIHIDLTLKAGFDSNYEVTVEDIEEWICNNGPIPPRAFIIFNTGWSFKRGNRYYGNEGVMDQEEVSESMGLELDELLGYLIGDLQSFSWPGISAKAAEYLLRHFFIIGIGIDTPSVDAGYGHSPVATEVPDSRPVRRFLTSYGIYLVHNILLLDIHLPPRGIFTTLGVFYMQCATRAPVDVYVEYCIDRNPTLQCHVRDHRNIIFGIHPNAIHRF